MREGKAKVLNENELKRLIRVAGIERHGSRNVAVCYCLWGLGLRIGEVASIRVSDTWDETNQTIRQQFQIRKANSKTNQNREVYLSNPKIRRALLNYIKHRHTTEGASLNPQGPLFVSQKGGAFTANTLQMMIKRLCCKKAGLPDSVSSHSGRRFFATSLIARNIDLKSVSSLLGHSSTRQSSAYADSNPITLEKIAARAI